MRIEKIKNVLRKRAVIFETGGKRPTKELFESWIGRIGFCLSDEELPIDADGNEMYPLAMLFLSELPSIPCSLQKISMLAVFLSENIYEHLVNDDFEGYYLIREYKNHENLQPCNWIAKQIQPFPLTPKLVEDDYPVWEDSRNIPDEIRDEILLLEDEDDIEYNDDIREESYWTHKIGGYPSYCQGCVNFDNEYEFAFQISSDEKAHFNVVDEGSFYFFKNIVTGQWKCHCDFY